MKKSLPAFARLCIITLIAAILLAVTNYITQGPIADAARAAADEARRQVLSGADTFEEMTLPQGAAADSLYMGKKGDELTGYAAAATVQGSQGPVEVIIGVNTLGEITGVSVGGSKFAETAGLGTKCQEPAFTDQFIWKKAPVKLGDGVDAISGATVTSTAVVKAVNLAYEATNGLIDTTASATVKEEEKTDADSSASVKEEEKTDADSSASVKEEEKTDASSSATKEGKEEKK